MILLSLIHDVSVSKQRGELPIAEGVDAIAHPALWVDLDP